MRYIHLVYIWHAHDQLSNKLIHLQNYKSLHQYKKRRKKRVEHHDKLKDKIIVINTQ